MRNLEEVTEEEIKTAYENTPALREYFTWEQVVDNPMLIITLKNQVIAKEENKMEIQTGTTNVFVLPVIARMPVIASTPLPAPAPAPKKEIRRSTITLDEKQIDFSRLNHSSDKNIIAVNLNDWFEQARKRGQEVVSINELKRVLPDSKHYRYLEQKRVRSRVDGATVRCWMFAKPTESPPI